MIFDMRTTIGTLAVALSLGTVAVVHARNQVEPLDVRLVSSCTSTSSRTCGIDRRLHPDRTSPVPVPDPAPGH
ncbi:hypothetical protein FB382_003399 [Nocardioides ginsengisegetis]|uniref:Uncharacterized protein n=1 Tax=Nocardioides ginsengisegetis TaxID=661491 RepID=A0A7W3PAY9_9ACTN|nr:hypothetical protein [Nocardioides ginsengisegetis]MBA8805108.1 hypothetical protein [Nocardioides ginsengisegetis]